MTPTIENLKAALHEIHVSLTALGKVTADQLAAMPDEGGWHLVADVFSAAELLQEAEESTK
jgi:hypothetical protein